MMTLSSLAAPEDVVLIAFGVSIYDTIVAFTAMQTLSFKFCYFDYSFNVFLMFVYL